MLLHCRTKYV